ncbi:MAG: hypothetical protein H0X37_04200 [Herpetosiphonaceae bacterium]|nr:hypothetical protein [Herpetosiphonaceae bacterium]
MRLPDFHSGVEQELRHWFRMSRGERTRDERWATLSQRIAAHEHVHAKWTPAPQRRREYRGVTFMMPWGILPRFIG